MTHTQMYLARTVINELESARARASATVRAAEHDATNKNIFA